jgi:hypothetical protein
VVLLPRGLLDQGHKGKCAFPILHDVLPETNGNISGKLGLTCEAEVGLSHHRSVFGWTGIDGSV